MANKNHVGEEYFCAVCRSFFISKGEQLDEVELKHKCGEELVIVTIQCPYCESMSIPEGMNQIAWLREGMGFHDKEV